MATNADIARAVEALRRGGLVAFPTETVYGLGADATNVDALARLYAVKSRPREHPVIVHVAAPELLEQWALDVPRAARRLADALWPGPLTIVVRRAAGVPDAVTGGGDTVGVRVPDQPVALALLRAFGGGIAAPSANRFGRVSPTKAEDVRADLGGEVDVVLDDGLCSVGVESTIVDCTGAEPVILRPGGVSRERISELVGNPVPVRRDGLVRAPGTLKSHYAPEATVLLVDRRELGLRAESFIEAGQRVAVLASGTLPSLPRDAIVLDAPEKVDEYARVLYSRLREADRLAVDVVLAVLPPDEGVGAAVADRLRRAAGGGGGFADRRSKAGACDGDKEGRGGP
ncbi:MAG TPA: L-threonylcarbamoyladenylate synthase [Acidimicrobiia bacterium]|nr:L-threonylcarbamoyladenylate synthase [Acidimicrobiia bacterium]